MLQIIPLETDEHRDRFRQLLWEYLTWMYAAIERELNVSWDVNNTVNKITSDLSKFAPPKGRLLLANYDSKIVGCVGLRKIADDVGEVKNIYVQPSHQKKGIGRALLTATIEEASQIGYSKIVLATPLFLKEVHDFYYSVGFSKIKPYPQTKIPEAQHQNWLFMEKTLQ